MNAVGEKKGKRTVVVVVCAARLASSGFHEICSEYHSIVDANGGRC